MSDDTPPILAEIRVMRDDAGVVMAILRRRDVATTGRINEVCPTHSRHNRPASGGAAGLHGRVLGHKRIHIEPAPLGKDDRPIAPEAVARADSWVGLIAGLQPQA